MRFVCNMCECVCVLCVCVYVCIHLFIYVRMCMHVCVQRCNCMSVCLCAFVGAVYRFNILSIILFTRWNSHRFFLLFLSLCNYFCSAHRLLPISIYPFTKQYYTHFMECRVLDLMTLHFLRHTSS